MGRLRVFGPSVEAIGKSIRVRRGARDEFGGDNSARANLDTALAEEFAQAIHRPADPPASAYPAPVPAHSLTRLWFGMASVARIQERVM